VDADEPITYNTGYGIRPGREARLEFVLTNRNDWTKDVGDVVTIHYDAATVSELDAEGPRPDSSFINAARDNIYLYFNEAIASKGLAASDFTLSEGSVTGARLENYGDAALGLIAAYVVLDVSGISDISGLTLSYIGGTITDTSPNKNEANAFSGNNQSGRVRSAATSIDRVSIGNDGKTLRVEVSGGYHVLKYHSENNMNDVKNFFTFTQNGSNAVIPAELNWSWGAGHLNFIFKFDAQLAGDLQVKLDMAQTPNWAYDTEGPKTSGVTNNMAGKAAAPVSVTYSKSQKTFTVNYGSELILGGSIIADGFTATISGAAYKLRGFNAYVSYGAVNEQVLEIRLDSGRRRDDYLQYVAGLLENAQNLTLSYSIAHGTNTYFQPIDIGGALLPAFTPQTVTVTD
jgi:hypothetical protein